MKLTRKPQITKSQTVSHSTMPQRDSQIIVSPAISSCSIIPLGTTAMCTLSTFWTSKLASLTISSGFKSTTAVTTFTDNIAAGNIKSTTNSAQISLNSAQKQTGNSWQQSSTWNNAAFKSVDIGLVQGKREATTGKIAASNFLLPANGATIGATTAWS